MNSIDITIGIVVFGITYFTLAFIWWMISEWRFKKSLQRIGEYELSKDIFYSETGDLNLYILSEKELVNESISERYAREVRSKLANR